MQKNPTHEIQKNEIIYNIIYNNNNKIYNFCGKEKLKIGKKGNKSRWSLPDKINPAHSFIASSPRKAVELLNEFEFVDFFCSWSSVSEDHGAPEQHVCFGLIRFVSVIFCLNRRLGVSVTFGDLVVCFCWFLLNFLSLLSRKLVFIMWPQIFVSKWAKLRISRLLKVEVGHGPTWSCDGPLWTSE